MTVNLHHYIQMMKGIAEASSYQWSQTAGKGSHVTVMYEKAESLYQDTEAILDELSAHGNFATVWPRCRVWFPLQFRLCAEQVMYDRGGAWRRYVTGFLPISGADGLPSPRAKAPSGGSKGGKPYAPGHWALRNFGRRGVKKVWVPDPKYKG